jgi:peptide/nickel transport system substrate-binding protein
VRRGSSALWRLLAVLLALTLVAAACGDDDDDEGAQPSETTAADEEVPTGGQLVIGAEQEPDCVDWMGTCAGSSWGSWMMGVTTLPRAYDIVKKGDDWDYAPSILLDGEAELETTPKQKVTYKLNPDAKWSDGTPITSKDFKYSWEQIVNGKDIYDTTGYANIESIDDSDPKTVVVTFKEPFADWKGTLFGVLYGVFPAHLLEGKDRNAEMANGYTWSGGPWKIEKWQKGVEAVLVPNENYWGEKPKLERVTFRFITDSAAEFQAFKAGEVSLIYPQPQLDAVDQINAGLTGAESSYTDLTGFSEALWLNNGKPPFDDVNFRKAVAYALDRDAIVERLFGGLGLDKAMNTLNPTLLSKYADEDAFAMYKKDLDKVEEHMTKSGWAKGPDGIWAKGGQKATFEVKTTAGNKRRELTQQILQQQLKAAGIEMTISNTTIGELVSNFLPKGDFHAGIYAQQVTSISPTLYNIMFSKNIPSEANEFSGQNWQRINIPELDPLLETVNNSLDDDERVEAQQEADRVMAEHLVAIPLDPLPNILLWSESVVGPVEDNPISGPFTNMHQWGIRQ